MIKEYDGKQPIKEIINSEKVVVDFFATWCGPCNMMSETLKDAIKLQEFEVIKIDIDKYRELAIEYGVRSVPTLFLFKNGELKNKNLGFLSVEEFLKFIK